MDGGIVKMVVEGNRYRFPPRFPSLPVIDVGAHIGASATELKRRGASVVWAIEPQPENVKVLRCNLGLHDVTGSVFVLDVAVGYTNSAFMTPFPLSGGNVNTGCARVGEGTVEVRCVTLESIVSMVASAHDSQVILKLDCEGAEFDIIRHADPSLFEMVHSVYGEYHEGNGNSAKVLAHYFEGVGFDVRLYDRLGQPGGGGFGKFVMVRR
jgi:FkbM family methyltransferase